MSRFQPYENNGGTCLAVAGKGYCVIAADTRMSNGYSIQTRDFSRVFRLTDKCVLGTSGMQADFTTLVKVIRTRIRMYEHQHGRTPPLSAVAQLLSNTLYGRRFFPYYAFNVLGGIDEEGNGVAYNYDAVGSFERVQYSSAGSGEELVQPLLDNQIGWKDQKLTALKTPKTSDEVIDLVKDALTSAGERDIHTGDFADICLVTAEGVAHHKFDLKFD
mmetsp:Transcript_31037/g.42694  ORF Transcript_31037/g.42694 Transcript_31037/m.42694 type:complete len:217 (-) Transcript_31037:151-801(-)|eukprot:CAMPEP_0201475140 /NCGR_PEP_ID=MMETSP0151_2-20130828/592_1 /ASSEMBLY_ACC=CAM_ASM_000257 /TAXON_ID=200890 /ORGANISM="Paramoeba atlantica, Strain 621/1 / CCAP 1560/9" /LENGTH=216 /DNA_ID=CAMNT_0047855155 /DNA_START=72 /DNA_END=722 /DNA_ORIENTATION=+